MTANPPVAALQLTPGSTLGDYRIERLLGRGGMGTVYQATKLSDGRTVAIKLLSVDLDQMDSKERFLREGKTAAAINHPNAVYIYGTEEISGIPVIVMELVPGGTLEELVRSNGPVNVATAVEYMLQIIDGLDAALAAGVLHRDVKPSNCFVAADGTVKIGDFGLSKPIESAEQHKLTQTGLFLGTPVYSSPEQLLGETLDVRSDIYAVGVTFYYLLTGRLPYESGSLMQVMAAVLNGTPAPMDSPSRKLPLHVQQVVLRTMSRYAKDRFQSYAALRSAIADLRAAEFRPATLWERLRAWIVDTVPLSYITSSAVLVIAHWQGRVIDPNNISREISLPLINTVGLLLAVALPEGLRGMGLGKWLLGIRVIGDDDRPIGLARSAVRILLLSWSGVATVIAYSSINNEKLASVTVGCLYVLSMALPFVTARKSNGWRLLHDVLTRSRVVRPVVRQRQRRPDLGNATQPIIGANHATRGHYAIVGTVDGHDSVVVGWDDAMHRRVWIAPAKSDGGNAAARHGLSRLTRLRWAGAFDEGGERYDVFEAPGGTTLQQRLSSPASWDTQRNWLIDLVAEARAASLDHSWPASATVNDLWITSSDELVLCDVAPSHPGDVTPAQSLVADVAKLLLQTKTTDPRPTYATRLLEQLSTPRSLDESAQLLSESLSRPAEVTRRRRVGPFIIIAAILLFFSVISRWSAGLAAQSDSEGTRADQLVEFLRDPSGCSVEVHAGQLQRRCVARAIRDSAPVGNLATLRSAGSRMMASLGLAGGKRYVEGAPKDSMEFARERHLVSVYLASQLRTRILDSTTKGTGLSGKKRAQARQIVDTTNVSDRAAVGASVALVDSLWQRNSVDDPADFQVYIMVIITAVLLCVLAVFQFASNIVARRGVLLRAFQLDIVTADGRPARRWRLVLRSLVQWSFLLVLPVALVLLRAVPFAMQPLVLLTLIVVALAGWCYGFVKVVRHPSRALPERVTGTFVVLE